MSCQVHTSTCSAQRYIGVHILRFSCSSSLNMENGEGNTLNILELQKVVLIVCKLVFY